MLTPATPESVGMSSPRLARIDQMITKAMGENVIPGAVAMICRNGKIVYQKAFGYSLGSAGKLFKTDDIFRIASQSKAITTTAAMMLWEEGKFNLDDPISKYIPDFKNPTVLESFNAMDSTYTSVPAGKEITVRNLMTHTSGLGYGVIDGDPRFKAIYNRAGVTDLFTTENITIGESVKKLARLPLHYIPGEAYVYSEGLDVLGYLIEIWSGISFSDFLQTRLFQPLGMKDTYFYLPDSKASRLIDVQTKDAAGKWIATTEDFYNINYPRTGAKKFYSGGAGLSSTVFDYATFLQMYLNKGELNGQRILSRKTIEFMLQNQIDTLFSGANGDKGFGLGYGILNAHGAMRGGLGSQGTFEWGGYFNTSYFADPKENIIGLIFKQTRFTGGDYTSAMFRQMVFAALDD